MNRIHLPRQLVIVCAVAVSAALVAGLSSTGASSPEASLSGVNSTLDPAIATASVRTKDAYGKLPLSFEANQGQFDARVKNLARGPGYILFLTANGAVLSLSSKEEVPHTGVENSETRPRTERAVVSLEFKNANTSPEITPLGELPGRANYFIGNDPEKWRTEVPTYAQVQYRNVYRGIDVLYYGNQRQLEYDFIVAPGADPRVITLAFTGAEKIRVVRSGDLILQTSVGDIRQSRPFAYQEIDGIRREVSAGYQVKKGRVSFRVGRYDRTQPLIIDPVIIYSSFLGGNSSEQGLGIAIDSQGSAFVTGNTDSTDFPIVAGASQGVKDAVNDAYVAKLNPAGNALVYSTYLGGNGDDFGNAIAIDAQGNAYVVGLTGSGSFPTTPGAFQNIKGAVVDAFVSKLNPSGSALVYSTFLGGDNNETAFGVVARSDGRAYVVGRTESTRFSFIPLQRNGSPLFKSINAAGQWNRSDGELTPISVTSIAQDPVNANTLWVGSNAGVFKSTTAGAHWNPGGTSNTGTAPTSTNVVVIDPVNTSIIYAGTNNGVYKSVNGGDLFAQKNNGILSTMINALVVDPSTPTTLYAGTSLGIFKSTNGGDNWVEVRNGISGTAPRVNEIAFDPTNSQTLYIGTNRGIYKTTNGASSWTAINAGPLTNVTTITALVIDPINPLNIYAGGSTTSSVLLKTSDGGVNWINSANGLTFVLGSQTLSPVINALAIDPVTPANVYAATSGGGMYKTTNSGANWSQSNTGLANTLFNAVIVDRTTPATVYAGTNIGGDGFLVRFDPAGIPDALMNLGGTENDEARGVALDSDGNAYVVGFTSSLNFPVLNPFQPANAGLSDAFVSKINPTATGFVYSTYLGGEVNEQGRAIAVRSGNAYVVGQTTSAGFPLVNAIRTSHPEFDPDAFVTKFNAAGSELDYSTLLGGLLNDQALGVAVDSSGSSYITGFTFSGDFPVLDAFQPGHNGSNDAFLTKLSPAGSSIVYSSYLGGANSDAGSGVAVDSLGNAYVVGSTTSTNFPTLGGLQTMLKGSSDAFVAKIGIEANLSISKIEQRDPVMVNNPLRYTVRVDNNGPSAATAVVVTDTLVAGLTFVSATPSAGNCTFNSPTITCQIGSIPAFGSSMILITVTPGSVGTVNNTATVQGAEPDSVLTNNSSTESTKISASPSINGRVRDANGNGISALMTLSGSQSATVQTDANGFYQFAELPAGGNYTVTPSNNNFSFAPPSQSFNLLNTDQSADFVATACVYDISPVVQSFAAAGGSADVTVTSLSGCPWTATTDADWITIHAGASGVGNGTVSFTVGPATGPRAGHLTIAGKNFAVYQEFGSCGAPSFTIANYNLSSGRVRAQVAELNGDTSPDVVISAIFSGGGVTAMINDGSGGFSLNHFTFQFEPQGIALSDFNGDGKPDAAATSYNTSFVRILMNNGNGGFGQSTVDVPFTTQVSPLTRGLFAGDINNDNKSDLLVLTPGVNALQVLLGNGSGAFTQQPQISITPTTVLLGLLDVNGNGALDLIIGGGGDNSHPLAIRLGDGTGTFGAPIISAGPLVTISIAPGDFNADGKLDLAASTVIPAANSTPPNPTFTNGVTIFAGDGAGNFVPKSSLDVGSPGSLPNVAAADFNRDGKTDVAYTRGGSKVNLVLGDGLGGLGTALPIDTGASDATGGNFGIAAADFNGDAKSDLAVADASRGASILRNSCTVGPQITGRITDSRTTGGLGGVTVTLSGAQSAVTQTDGSGNYFFSNLTAGSNYVVTPSLTAYRFVPVDASINNITGPQVANFVGTPTTVQFTLAGYVVDEHAGFLEIQVSRTGDVSGISTVDYATIDGTASSLADYTTAVGTLRFAPGETNKSFNVLITNDSIVEGWELLTLTLSNPTGAILGLAHTPFLEIRDNDVIPSPQNAIDDPGIFVRQHYYDFLNRVPDQGGFDYWTAQITDCGSNALCIHHRRIGVSAAFFIELEFQRTGYVVYRMHRAAFGLWPGTTTRANLAFPRFMSDRSLLPEGADLTQSTIDYANAFVQRPEFLAAFPANQTNAQFVNQLFDTAELVPYTTERQQQIDAMTNNGKTRAQVLLDVIEIAEFKTREYNRSFVLMQYFGYLRRDPDQGGYDFWLNVLDNREPNNFRGMVCSFITSTEYQQRFGTAITRSNQDCSLQ